MGGNWKCNGTVEGTRAFATELSGVSLKADVDMYVAPSSLHVCTFRDALSSQVEVAAQDCWKGPCGAFTGEVSAQMLRDAGVTRVILGHSERRTLCGETDLCVRKKVIDALANDLVVSLCVGETARARADGTAVGFCITQLESVMNHVPVSEWYKIIVVYEPLWAIGTGIAAEPETVQQMHAAIRKWLAEHSCVEQAAEIRITYGGSINRTNYRDYVHLDDVDGFLIGGASLSYADFIEICMGSSAGMKTFESEL